MKQTKTKYGKMKQIISNLKLPDYRYEQLTKAIFHQKIDNFDDMHILPKALRIALVNEFGNNVSSVIPVFSQDSKQAQKLLFELTDGERIEAVGLKYKQGWESFFYLKETSEKESVMFICTNCRKIMYFSDGLFDEYLKKEEKEHAYRVISKKFEIYGLCPQCRVSG